MDVQQAGGGADPGPEQAGESGSRVGLIVGAALALLVVLVVVVVLLLRDDDGAQPAASPAPTATATATVTASPTASPTSTATPTASPTQLPGDVPELRADGIGPLDLRMTAAQAVATGDVTEQDGDPPLVPDSETYPGLSIGYDPDLDSIESFVVSDSSPIRTPDGIGVDSTPQDIQDAYGPLVLEQTDADTGEVWYLVAVDDVGYAFVPAEDELVLVSGTDTFLLDLVPSRDL